MASASPDAATPTPRARPSNLVPMILTGIGFLFAVICGFLEWFSISGSSFTILPDAYRAMYVYITQGSSSLQTSNALGAMLVHASTSNPIVLVGFALVLFFWPAMFVSSLFNLAARSYGPYPFVWGLVLFIGAYITVHFSSNSLASGAYFGLVGAVILLIASLTYRAPKPAASATTADTTPPSTSGATASTNSTPPQGS